MNANPAAAVPDQRRARAALTRDDLFTVVLEHRLTDTADLADVVLPATMGPEHLDVATGYGHHYVAWNEPAVEAPGECLPNTEIMRRLAAALGLDHPRLRDTDLELARQVLATAGIDADDLRTRGWLRASTIEPGTAPYAGGGFPTPSGKVELSASAFTSAGFPEAVDYVPPAEAADEARAARYPLVLVSAAGRFLTSSTFAASEWHLGKAGPPRIHLHADDAAAYGVVTGDQVRVHNDRGSFSAEVAIDDRTRPGVAYTRKTYWPKRSGGTNVNATTAERDTDLGGGPTFHDTRVALEPLLPTATGSD
ncbi:MAG: molybdopterin dinucleotide binding domain-containing protein [Thermoleophilia bacterium]